MTENQFKLLQLNETILYLGDIVERSADPENAARVLEEIARLENEKTILIKKEATL